MQIDSSMNLNMATFQKEMGVKPLYTRKVEGDELKALKQKVFENTQAFSFSMTVVQSSVERFEIKEDVDFQKQYEAIQKLLDDIGYKGKHIADLTQDEAKELVGEDGFFGVKQTARRIADFVIEGAKGDEQLLRAGLEGIQRGFEEAEKIWGGTLPDISYRTIDAAKELIQKEMAGLGYAIVDASV